MFTFEYRLHKHFCVREDKESSQSSVTTRQSFTSHLELKLASKEPDVASGELKLEQVIVSEGSVEIASILDRILDTSYTNSSFEACKLKTYIRECWDVQTIDDEFPTGVHPDRYQEFVGGMAQYIVDKQLTHQRESLSYDMVYVSGTGKLEIKEERNYTVVLAISFFLWSCAVEHMGKNFNTVVVANAIVFIVIIQIRNSSHFINNYFICISRAKFEEKTLLQTRHPFETHLIDCKLAVNLNVKE